MEVSDAVTERLLSFDKDEESEFTLSEVSSISSDKINVSKEPPATKSVSVTPSWPVSSLPSPVPLNPVVGINPAVPRPFKSVRPPSLRVCPRPRLPIHLNNCFQQPSPTQFRPSRPPFPSELSRPALSPRSNTPCLARPVLSTESRPVSTTRPQFFIPPPRPFLSCHQQRLGRPLPTR